MNLDKVRRLLRAQHIVDERVGGSAMVWGA
jgi:hypothetical protein